VLVVVSDSLYLPLLMGALAPERHNARVFISPIKSSRIWSSEMPESLWQAYVSMHTAIAGTKLTGTVFFLEAISYSISYGTGYQPCYTSYLYTEMLVP
jgi:hypothetical protein